MAILRKPAETAAALSTRPRADAGRKRTYYFP